MKPMSYKETISKPTDCGAVRKILDAAELNAQQSLEVISHCEKCPSCRRYELELTGLRSLLAGQPRVQAPADFDLKLRQRLAASRGKKEQPLVWWSIVWQSSMAFAALVVVGLLVGSVYFQYIQKPTHNVSPNTGQIAAKGQLPASPIAGPVKPAQIDSPREEMAIKTAPAKSGVERVAFNVKRPGRNPVASEVVRTLTPAEADEISFTFSDGANQTSTQKVQRVIFGAQPIVKLGEMVDSDDLEGSSMSQESTIF